MVELYFSMVELYLIIIALVIAFIGCPILGRILYKMENKIAVIFYLIVTFVISILVFIFTEHPDWTTVSLQYQEYFQNLAEFNFLFIFSLIVYAIGGFGLIGGILEFVGEHTESADVYRKLHRFTPIKLYLYSFLYGYIFLFAVYAFSQFLSVGLNWQYAGSPFGDLIYILQFHNVILVLVGNILFSIKSFRYGIFSFEYYRSEFDPKVTDLGKARKELRRMLAFVLGVLGIFVSCIIYYLDVFPNQAGVDISLGKAIYFLAASIQAIIFYLLRNKYVDQLKPLEDQFELKVGKGQKKTSTKAEYVDLNNEHDLPDYEDLDDSKLRFDD